MQLNKDQISLTVQQAAQANSKHSAIACCAISGMSFSFPGLPLVDGQALVIESPLKRWTNVRGYCRRPLPWLEKQGHNFLAGLVLAGLGKWDLVSLGEGSAVEANAVLSQSATQSLCTIVQWIGKMDDKNVLGLPVLVMEWQEVKHEKFNATSFLEAYVQRLKPYFDAEHKAQLRIMEVKKAKIDDLMDQALTRMGRKLPGAVYLSAAETYKEKQREAEEAIKQAKKLIKATLDTPVNDWLGDNMRNMLHTLTQGQNLVVLHDELRAKIVARLKELGQSALAEAISKAKNPHDIFAQASKELDRASDAFGPAAQQADAKAEDQHQTKHQAKSIKELLALRAQKPSSTPEDF